ncbi:addiction module antidote protein [Methylovirgula sp. 4M-Z18]|uniref:addiction module antidote protein n=1 Tax=Methylovirgula sp. 4M-Z18 TaxID=2293567 RepID=UPI000E2E4B67|nr:addiction module antidote protein [Methylovirgula sp. 4M-Z18]RFB80194.1 putative addiction module antidote protein [Methylovirgula sp. 4M-Z18]
MFKLQRDDAALCVRSEADIRALIDDVAQTDDPMRLIGALDEIARSRNMSQLARDCGLSRVGLIKALAPGGNPGFMTIVKVAQALGLRIVITAR